jgi:hypothetical protein
MNVVSVANIQIGQFDNLYSLNDLHRAAGGLEKHKPANWLRNQQTADLIAELEKAQIRAIQKKQKLGTFVCKELVVHYGMWISPTFSLKVIRAFLDTQEEASANPKTTADDRTGLRQAVSALVGKCGIDYSSAYSMVHQRFGVAAIEDIPADKMNDAVQYVHTLTLHSGLNGEVLDRLPEKLQARKIAIDERTLISIGRLLLYAQEQRCFVSRYLPAFENLGIGGRGKLWSFVHDTDPVFEHIRHFFTGQCPALGHWAKDSDLDWLHRRILSTAEA